MKKYYLDFLLSTNKTELTLSTHVACKIPHKKTTEKGNGVPNMV